VGDLNPVQADREERPPPAHRPTPLSLSSAPPFQTTPLHLYEYSREKNLSASASLFELTLTHHTPWPCLPCSSSSSSSCCSSPAHLLAAMCTLCTWGRGTTGCGRSWSRRRTTACSPPFLAASRRPWMPSSTATGMASPASPPCSPAARRRGSPIGLELCGLFGIVFLTCTPPGAGISWG
jgi:hypothetical protein